MRSRVARNRVSSPQTASSAARAGAVAAWIAVRDGDGNVAFSGPVVFLPQDGNYTSYGVIKVPDARPYRLAFEAWYEQQKRAE